MLDGTPPPPQEPSSWSSTSVSDVCSRDMNSPGTQGVREAKLDSHSCGVLRITSMLQSRQMELSVTG
eukprot:765877-Hanusia_phi.AAC.1